MKLNYKSVLLIFILSLPYLMAYSQVGAIQPRSQPSYCPSEPITYTASFQWGLNSGCRLTWEVVNGKFVKNGQTSYTTTQDFENSVEVIWDNVVGNGSNTPKGRISVRVADGSNCSTNGLSASDFVDNIIIKTLNGVNPSSITISSTPSLCNQQNITASIPRLRYANYNPNIADNNPNQFADSYEWVIPTGWKIGDSTSDGSTAITSTSNSVSITPSPCNEGIIKVRGKSNCGNGLYSNWSNNATINRPAPNLSWSNTPSTSLVCGSTNGIQLTVNSLSCADSYHWTIPNGWTGATQTTSNTNIVYPDGTTNGTVSVLAKACNKNSNSISLSFSYQIADPNNPPQLVGPNVLSSTNNQTFTIENRPPSTTVVWTVGNNLSIIGGQGSANLIVRSSNSTYTGSSWVQVTISNNCGQNIVFRKDIWIGKAENGSGFLITNSFYFTNPTPPMASWESYASDWNVIYPRIDYNLADVLEFQWEIIGPHSSGSVDLTSANLTLRSPDYTNTQTSVRLRMRNLNGWSAWSNGIFATVGSDYEPWFIYPVPASSELNIELKNSNSEDFGDYVILDASQNIIRKGELRSDKEKVSIQGLKKGVYYIKLKNKEKSSTKRIVIE